MIKNDCCKTDFANIPAILLHVPATQAEYHFVGNSCKKIFLKAAIKLK